MCLLITTINLKQFNQQQRLYFWSAFQTEGLI
jgi:hypothetical protein